ncbi:MAG: DUF1553 domain-containing protein [Planctomycetaceae bacterium]|nr:DUF1553 domain-containing protein [Planctomycetaceae bacterium]
MPCFRHIAEFVNPCCCLTVLVWSGLVSSAVVHGAEPDFNRQIRPLLSDRCLSCHGPDAEHREADLRLDDSESLTRQRGTDRVVIPGDPDRSLLMHRILSSDPDLMMPPPTSGRSLSDQEKELLRQWILSGAKVEAHWAYVAPVETAAPRVSNESWVESPIDRWILRRLEKENVAPAGDADPVTLLRRVHFDLTGLPPSSEVVEEFVGNPTKEALTGIVEQLLNSDEYAERMAVYWLDLVRYADTVGYHGDQDHNSSPYRDWVIDAFADDMPFDRFTREQLAGDLLPNTTIDQQIASAYNRLLQTSHEGGVQPKEYLAIYAADRVRNVSAVWMGATVGCAQCHDHKYDPYTMKDFYSLAAFFADLDEDQHFRVGSNSLPTKRPPEIKVLSRRERQQLSKVQAHLNDIERRLSELPADAPEADRRSLQSEQKRLQNAVDDLEAAARLVMISVAKEPRVTRVLPRGNWLDETGPVVDPGVPGFLGSLHTKPNQRATRLDLANWLCDCEHGAGLLTARVMVNRLWYLTMGRGLCASLEDFGGQGSAPEHPELLDHLALRFVQSGWSVKSILKQIVTSHVYRQSSVVADVVRRRDPDNALFARQGSWRLPAEFVRDTVLDVSGLLVRKVGGRSVRPYQPEGYYRHLNFPVRKYSADSDEGLWRRGLYVHWQRQFLHPMLKAFDAPTREECTAQRSRSNTPLAALTLLNDPSFVEAARSLGLRILQNTSLVSDGDRINVAMLLAVSRPADETEQKLLMDVLQQSKGYYRSHPESAAELLAVGKVPTPDSVDAIELAAWASVARTVLNLDETVTRN